MAAIDYIFKEFTISNEEYEELEKAFGNLCHFAGHDLKRRNSANNMTEDHEDLQQILKWSMVKAAIYTKRQNYIDACFSALKENLKDEFSGFLIAELEDLWEKRTKHGNSKMRFGNYQELVLESLINLLGTDKRPIKNKKLELDSKGTKYTKQILWNEMRHLGKKITREKGIRVGMVSLSSSNYNA